MYAWHSDQFVKQASCSVESVTPQGQHYTTVSTQLIASNDSLKQHQGGEKAYIASRSNEENQQKKLTCCIRNSNSA